MGQRQDSTTDQLEDVLRAYQEQTGQTATEPYPRDVYVILHSIAVKLGCYDALDYIKDRLA